MNLALLSRIFRNFNKLRKLSRMNPVAIDIARLNRALGIAQSIRLQMEDAQYRPTSTECGCKDIEFYCSSKRKNAQGEPYRGPCKHELAQMLLQAQD